MKVLCIGCLHGTFPERAYAVAKKEKVDLVLCPGDLADGSFVRDLEFKHWDELHEGADLVQIVGKQKLRKAQEHSLKSQLRMAEKLDGFKLPLLLIAGNHDIQLGDLKPKSRKKYGRYTLEYLAHHSPYIHFMQVGVANFHGQEIGAISGYRAPAHKGVTHYEGKQALQVKLTNKLWDLQLKAVFGNFTDRKNAIFLCHDPPYKTKLDKVRNKASPMNGKHLGDEYVLKYIKKYQPKFVVCSHMHENQGKIKIGKTMVVNCGPAFKGKFAVVDTEKGKVRLY